MLLVIAMVLSFIPAMNITASAFDQADWMTFRFNIDAGPLTLTESVTALESFSFGFPLTLSSNATLTNDTTTEITWDLSNGQAHYACICNYQFYTNNNVQKIEVSDATTPGAYVIATGDFKTNMIDKDTFTLTGIKGAQDVDISLGGAQVTYNDQKFLLVKENNGTPGVNDDDNLVLYVGHASVDYIDNTGNTATQDCSDYTAVTPSDTAVTWNAGWYVVRGEQLISNQVTVSGDVKLILCDTASLMLNGSLNVSGANSLTVYAQSNSNNTGSLSVVGGSLASAIGGAMNNACGTIAIYGGYITANGGDKGSATYYGSGIGCGASNIPYTSGTIYVGEWLSVKAGAAPQPTAEIAHTTTENIAVSMNHKRYAVVEPIIRPDGVTSGNGTEAKPYIISDYDGLNDFAAYVNAGDTMEGKYIKLADDFGVAAKSGAKTALTTPIGNSSENSFKGIFDGNGKTVKLAIGSEGTPYDKENCGMFGYVSAGSVKNVTTSGTIYASKSKTGGVVGIITNGTVSNCHSGVNVSEITGTDGSAYDIGGVVGRSQASVTGCYFTGNVNCNGNNIICIGGVVGGFGNIGSVENCCSTGNVSVTCDKTSNIGGVVGEIPTNATVSGNRVTNCYSTGNVSVTCAIAENIGGVIGVISSACTIANCYATGTVTTNTDKSTLGGVVGGVEDCKVTFTNCYCLNLYGSSNGTALSAEQMKAGEGETKNTWVFVAAYNGYCSLTTLLNKYVNSNSGKGYRNWAAMNDNVNGGYPVFALDNYLYLKEGKAYSNTCTAENEIALPDGISYDDGTYTFNNVNIPSRGEQYLIVCDSNATIELKGNNQIGETANVEDSYGPSFGILAETNDLTLTGNGSLTVYSLQEGIYAKNITFDDDFTGNFTSYDRGSEGCCLVATDSVIIKNGHFILNNYNTSGISADKVSITGGNMKVKGGEYAIFTTTSLTLSGVNMGGTDAEYSSGTTKFLQNKTGEYLTLNSEPSFDGRFETKYSHVAKEGYSLYTALVKGTEYTVHDNVKYTFAGWFDGIDGTGTELSGAPVAGTTYYAKWTKGGKTVVTKPLDFFTGDDNTTYAVEQNGIKWTAATSTLTLNGVIMDVYADIQQMIVVPDYTELVITDGTTNSLIFTNISNPGSETYAIGLKARLGLAISGKGTLNISASAESDKVKIYGIFSNDDLSVSDATLNVDADVIGIYVDSVGGNKATFMINSGNFDVKISGKEEGCYGIYSLGDLTVKGGKVKVTGGCEAIIAGTDSKNGVLTIEAGEIDATARITALWGSESILISGGTVKATAVNEGTLGNTAKAIYCYNGNVEISGQADVTAIGSSTSTLPLDKAGVAYGIRAKAGDIKVIGDEATVVAQGDTAAFSMAVGKALTVSEMQIMAKTNKDGTGDKVTVEQDAAGKVTSDLTTAKYVKISSGVPCTYGVTMKAGEAQTLIIGENEAGTFTITGNATNGFSLKGENGKYVAYVNSTVKSDSDNSDFKWKYDGGLYTEIKTTVVTRTLFWSKTSVKTVKYYLDCDGTNFILTNAKTNAFVQVTDEEHNWAYVQCGDDMHQAYCTKCDYHEDAEKHSYEENGYCVCGKLNPELCRVSDVKVNEKKTVTYMGFWFWKKAVTKYQYTIAPVTQNVSVSKVWYSTDNKTWINGTSFTSDLAIGKFFIRVKDSNGKVTDWKYVNGKVSAVQKYSITLNDSQRLVSASNIPEKIAEGETVTISVTLGGTAPSAYVYDESSTLVALLASNALTGNTYNGAECKVSDVTYNNRVLTFKLSNVTKDLIVTVSDNV